MTRIVVTRSTFPVVEETLGAAGTVWVWPLKYPIPREILLERVAEAEGMLTMLTDRIDREILQAAPRLRAVSQMAVGVDNIDLAACSELRIPVGHTPDVLTETTADVAFGLLIAAARRFKEGMGQVAAGEWGDWDPQGMLGYDLHDSTLGIIGLGRIGQAVARRAAGFGMRILYNRRTRDPEAEARLGAEFRPLQSLLRESDHVAVLVGLTPETRHLIDGEALSLMKPTATLVNASRGPVVDGAALARALADGTIAAAGLDVTDPEPIPPDHPLVSLPNCLIVPHIGSATVRTRTRMAELAARNLVAALTGRRMPHCANPEAHPA